MLTWSASAPSVVVPVLTPMDDAGRVDDESLEALVEHCVGGGVDGVFVLGTSGEAMYLSEDDRARVVRVAAGALGGRVPLFVGVIETAVGRIDGTVRVAAGVGAAGVVVPPPFYGRVGPAEVRRHYRMAADLAAGLDVIAYNIPNRTHWAIEPDLVAELVRDGSVAALKDSDPELGRHEALIAATQGSPIAPGGVVATGPGVGIPVLTGSDRLALASLRAGSAGAVPGLANLAPQWFAGLVAAAARGDWGAAASWQDRIDRLAPVLDAVRDPAWGPDSGTYASLKIALCLLGVTRSAGTSAMLADLDTPQHRRQVAAALESAGM